MRPSRDHTSTSTRTTHSPQRPRNSRTPHDGSRWPLATRTSAKASRQPVEVEVEVERDETRDDTRHVWCMVLVYVYGVWCPMVYDGSMLAWSAKFEVGREARVHRVRGVWRVASREISEPKSKESKRLSSLLGAGPISPNRGVRRGAQRLGGSVTLRSKTANPQ
jgi:hypothetical protein